MGFTPCKAEQPLRGMQLQEKKHKKDQLQGTENLFRKNLLKDASVNSGLKVTKIIGKRKAFYRQRILEFSRVRKETKLLI